MRLRTKLAILLLLTALLPLAYIAATVQRGTRTLGSELAAEASDTLVRRAEQEQLDRVAAYATLMDQKRQTVELIVRVQAARLAAELLRDRPASDPPSIWTSTMIDAGNEPPGMATGGPNQFRVEGSGEEIDVRVSYQSVVAVPAPGVSADDARRRLAQLGDLVGLFESLRTAESDTIVSQYVSFADGVYFSYPAKGGFPAGFDGRDRQWYLMAESWQDVDPPQPSWIVPTIDAVTGQLRMSCALRIVGPDGELLGVTGADVLLEQILMGLERERTTDLVTTMLISLRDRRRVEPGADRPAIVVATTERESPINLLSERDEAMTLEQAFGEIIGQLGPLNEAVRADRQEPGLLRVEQDGRQTLWAFARLPDMDSWIVRVFPLESVLAESSRARDRALRQTQQQLQHTAVVVLATILIATALALLVARKLMGPVHRLVNAAERIASGDLDARVDIQTADEFEQLGDAFNGMVPKLREHMRMSQSLTLAMEVQQSLLPAVAPDFPGFEAFGMSLYCDETGGDYYDFLKDDEDKWLACAIGDVTGHGVASALLMATARALVHGGAPHDETIAQAMCRINELLCHDTRRGSFMTMFILSVDRDEQQMLWASAGHDPAIVHDPTADTFTELAGTGIPLGIERGWPYEQQAAPLPPVGSIVVLGTDGIWETFNTSGEAYGKQRLRAVIRRCAGQRCEEIAKAVLADVAAFRGSAPRTDDITIVVVKRVGN